MRSLYEELGIERGATAEEIKSAYRRRATETHPDKGGNREDFERVQQAYDVLGDDAARRRYDQCGDNGRTDIETPEQLAADCFRFVLRQGFPAGSDLVARAIFAMENGIQLHAADLRKWRGEVERLERYERRLRKREWAETPSTVLEDALATEKAGPVAKVHFHETAIARLKDALGILQCYEFGEGEIRIEGRVEKLNCPTCGELVATIFDHVDGCPKTNRKRRTGGALRKETA